MNKFNFALIALAAATFAGQALATDCKNGAPHSAWPECKLPTSTTPSQTQTGTQSQTGIIKSTNQNKNFVKSSNANSVKSANTNLNGATASTGPINVKTGEVKNTATGGMSTANGGKANSVATGGDGGNSTSTGGTSAAISGANAVGGAGGQAAGGNSTANGTVDANLTGVAAQAGAGAGANAGVEAGKNAGANAGAGAGSNNATTQNTTVNTGAQPGSGSTTNYSSKVIVHPSMIPAPPVTLNPQGNLLAVQTACSMIVNVQPVPVYATSQNFWGNTEQVQNGNNYLINPVYDENGVVIPFMYVPQADGSTIVIGNQLIVGMSITNQSIAVSGALGLIKSSGSGGQIGGGVSSSLQQMGDRVIAVPCMAGIIPAPGPLVVEVEKEVEVLVEVPVKKKKQ